MMTRIHLGCSGWSYEDWIGTFYPSRIQNKDMLNFYMRVFPTCEINTTFYNIPKKNIVKGWARRTPKNYIFAVKLFQRFTHEQLGKEAISQQEIDYYFEQISPLGLKLGPILIQLPPSYRYDIVSLEKLISLLPKKHNYAVEFRHISWHENKKEMLRLLEENNIAYCIVDEPYRSRDHLLPPEVFVTTAKFSYIRWHGLNPNHWYNYLYSQTQLEEWVPKIEKLSENVSEIYGYFNNHLNGQAPTNARQLLKLLGIETPDPKTVSTRPKGQKALSSFLDD